MISNPPSPVQITLGPAAEFMRGLWRLNHALEKLSRGMATSYGVTAQQRMIIRCVGKYPGVTASQLSEVFHLDAATLSTALARLERKGLLQRRRSPRDRRRVTLGLTTAGRAIDRGVGGTVDQAVERLFEIVSPEEIDSVQRVLGTFADLLHTDAMRNGHRVPKTAPLQE